MKRSSAPSFLGPMIKKPSFNPPSLAAQRQLSQQPVVKIVNSSQPATASRSTHDILRLIQDNVSVEATDQPKSFSDSNRLPECTVRCCRDEVTLHSAKESTGSREQERYFSVMWCKFSKKKHKTWEGDAVLLVKERSVTLYDLDGKEIGRGVGYRSSQLESLMEGEMLVIGGKEIQVMGVLSENDYKSGKCFREESENTSTAPAKHTSG